MTFEHDLTKPHYKCFSCGIVHKNVDAGGIHGCPNPFCMGCGNAHFRRTLKSYEEVENGKHIVKDDEEWFKKAFDKVCKYEDKDLRDQCFKTAAKSSVFGPFMKKMFATFGVGDEES